MGLLLEKFAEIGVAHVHGGGNVLHVDVLVIVPLHVANGLGNDIMGLLGLLFALPLQPVEKLLKIAPQVVQAGEKGEAPDPLQIHLQGGGELPDLVAEAVVIVQDVPQSGLVGGNIL